ncbi:MAG TPA: DNA-processing protein DprA [Candidatus Paceibacterota bacterium]|nr:DNA-processing protein DprA [Candidatus Paceibacterota bacterium]
MAPHDEIRPLAPEHFPTLLCEITDPPKQLWLRGELPSTERTWLAVVGSRKHTSYGADAARTLIEGLRGYPIVIVSGLALGIDAIAHEAALKAGLPTVAVPGSGITDAAIYPRTNAGLAARILDAGGALLTEYEPDFRATQWSFPRRNRIMAGLAHATLVIEADALSGTLITARLAMEYNRDVLAVPGSIFSPSSDGPNALIADGAGLVRSSEDLLRHLGFDEIDAAETPGDADHFSEDTLAEYSDAERAILLILREPLATDEVALRAELAADEANIALMRLAIAGAIRETRDGWMRER